METPQTQLTTSTYTSMRGTLHKRNAPLDTHLYSHTDKTRQLQEEDEGVGSAGSGGGQDNGKESGDADGGSGKGVVDMVRRLGRMYVYFL